MKKQILKCRFPFPPHDPPLQMPESCLNRCPNADPEILAQHSSMTPRNRDLLAAIDDFLRWFYAPDQPETLLEEQRCQAAILYTRDDHPGTCVPKTVLFMHYKHLQYNSYGPPLQLSDAAQRALKGERVPSWPDGELANGETWNQMFARYTMRYDAPDF